MAGALLSRPPDTTPWEFIPRLVAALPSWAIPARSLTDLYDRG